MKVDIKNNLERIKATLPDGVTLIAVSKYHPVEAIEAAYSAGQRHFGESKAQELRSKQQQLPHDIQWHFIGHLQSNKIKYIAPFVHLIHSIDSFKLLQEIDKQGAKANRIIPCLLQIHIAQEDTKFGFTPEECLSMLQQGAWRQLHNTRIKGLMCMASNTDETQQIAQEFKKVKELFDTIRSEFFHDSNDFDILSAGMSDDYMTAIENGSTHVRIGSDIFGSR